MPSGFFPDRAALLRIASLLGALVASVLLLERLGYSLTMFLFCGFLLRVLGKQPWWLTAILTLLGSFGTAFLFRQLQVILPRGFLGICRLLKRAHLRRWPARALARRTVHTPRSASAPPCIWALLSA